jgi:hypothetical protein
MRAHDRRTTAGISMALRPWACGDCDCTARLEKKLSTQETLFLKASPLLINAETQVP